MSNKDRKEKRYQRRKAKRLKKKENFLNSILSYEEVFTFEHLWKSYWLCRKEVGWKPSLQIFQHNLGFEITKLMQILHSPRGFCTHGFIEFYICERGKMRRIRSVDIQERVVQRCFCDYYIVPLLTHNLIYDNGASLKDKGITFALNRLLEQLETYYKKYQTNEGYMLFFDFHDFFGSIDHDILYAVVDALIKDDKCKKLYHHLVDAFGSVGLGLGSQVSQVSAVAFPNKIDHTLINFSATEAYARYMDDGYAIFHTKADVLKAKEILFKECNKMGIIINSKKIGIIKINKTFIFLKKRFFLNNNGKAIMRLNRNNIYKHKRKIMKLFKLKDQGKIMLQDIDMSHKSWIGQLKKFKNKKSIHDIDIQIRRLLKNDEYKTDISINSCCIGKS